MTYESVDLPDPFGPMMAATSPAFTVSDSPSRIFLPSTSTWRFLISSIFSSVMAGLGPAIECRRPMNFIVPGSTPGMRRVLSHTPLEADRDQLLRLDGELHWQLLQHVANEAVDDQSRCLFAREPALLAIEELVLGDFRRGRLVLEHGRVIARL